LLEDGFAHVIVDLRRVTFLDSTGIRTLITAQQRAKDLGSRLSIRLGGSSSRRALEFTGALDYLEIESDVPGARDGNHGWRAHSKR
jgi:anti-anti-sigma factor